MDSGGRSRCNSETCLAFRADYSELLDVPWASEQVTKAMVKKGLKRESLRSWANDKYNVGVGVINERTSDSANST